AGMPDAIIKNISFNNLELKHPGGGNPLFAKVSLNELDRVPEEKATYPEFSKFKELPAWGIYIRHARDIKFSNVKLSCAKKDYRTAIVMDDVHQAEFITTTIKEVDKKKPLFEKNSSGVIFK
ncbi:MAG TPA: glycoside hydrolase, partial [Chitinophagaceae bacterium]|nr:glycoside hydrolase [Chitinophagaceae bacterium]